MARSTGFAASPRPSNPSSGRRKTEGVCDTNVRRFAQMPADRRNPGVYHTARQNRDEVPSWPGSLGVAGMRSRRRPVQARRLADSESAAACQAAPQQRFQPCVHIRSEPSRFADELPRRPLSCRSRSRHSSAAAHRGSRGSSRFQPRPLSRYHGTRTCLCSEAEGACCKP